MKVIYLLRHAKSSWKDPILDDIDHPLAKRGRQAGKLMEKFLAREGIRPELILCSPAQRTRETLEFIRKSVGKKVPVSFEDGIYIASADGLLACLRRFDDAYSSVMMIGHNPGM